MRASPSTTVRPSTRTTSWSATPPSGIRQHPLHIGRTAAFDVLPRPLGWVPEPAAAGLIRVSSTIDWQGRRDRGAPARTIPAALHTEGTRRRVTRFIVRRLLVTIPVLLGIIFIVFALARARPGRPVPRRARRTRDRRRLRRLHPALRPRPSRIPDPVRDLPRRSSCRATSGVDQALPPGHAAAGRAAADDASS